MMVGEHVQTARAFLDAADPEFADGDSMQASEKMWGAASHAVKAVAHERSWPCGSHRDLSVAVRRLSEECGDPSIRSGFGLAEKFHANFYTGFMEQYHIDQDRPFVQEFVERLVNGSVGRPGPR
jgi:hypothetical protein